MNKLFFLLLLISNVAIAKNVQGTGTIKNVYFHSKDAVIAANWKGMLQLEVNSLSWNVETSCNTQYVAVREKDVHIISAVLAAKMANKPITVYANDDIKATGSYCYLRAVGM
ncbi:hypothetical protein [Psychromonas sp. Urea-02u-13]|uniref:hypothetical protein n=1 Tax=Psychromonas sp. Urea-02u-13 TaxID=2058326 RepID=UPI000CB62DC2|nr:hypothetical protein [Psychromonas sp. Urea-02u-13]PKG37033.1 hypothetical protein CXF74_21020 [Psychromonas sp. Urea-02u-13]